MEPEVKLDFQLWPRGYTQQFLYLINMFAYISAGIVTNSFAQKLRKSFCFPSCCIMATQSFSFFLRRSVRFRVWICSAMTTMELLVFWTHHVSIAIIRSSNYWGSNNSTNYSFSTGCLGVMGETKQLFLYCHHKHDQHESAKFYWNWELLSEN